MRSGTDPEMVKRHLILLSVFTAVMIITVLFLLLSVTRIPSQPVMQPVEMEVYLPSDDVLI